MIQEKSFESTFNEWYKMFLEEEQKLTLEVSTARKLKEEKLNNAMKEAKVYLESYDKEQRENLEVSKARVRI